MVSTLVQHVTLGMGIHVKDKAVGEEEDTWNEIQG